MTQMLSSGLDRIPPSPCDISDEPRTDHPGQLRLWDEPIPVRRVLKRPLVKLPLSNLDLSWNQLRASACFVRLSQSCPDPEDVYGTMLDMGCPLEMAGLAWDAFTISESEFFDSNHFGPRTAADGENLMRSSIEAIPDCQPSGNDSADSCNAAVRGSFL